MNRLWVLIVLAACGGKGGNECRTEAEGLSKFLMETPHDLGTGVAAQPGLVLVQRDDLTETPAADALTVVVTETAIYVEGIPAKVETIGEAIERIRARRRSLKDMSQLYFHLDRNTPWGTLVQLVDAARAAGMKQIGFGFTTKVAKLTPPPRSAVDDKLDAILNNNEPSQRAVEVARLMAEVVKDCPALQRDFGKVSAADSTESKADILIKAIAPALIECNCNADLPSLRSAMWKMIAVEPNLRAISFDATTGTKLALPATTTWEQASKQLAPKTNYQLGVQ